jgi:hypothetical protein
MIKPAVDYDRERVRVTMRNRCPICQKPDYCTVFPRLGTVCCMRIQSDKPARNGGWWHAVDGGAPSVKERLMRRMPVLRRAPSIDPGAMLRRWGAETRPEQIEAYAAALGVHPLAVETLGACWAAEHGAWAWPMHDGAGTVCGIRLRSDEHKWAVRGSRQGVFLPAIAVPAGVDVIICEGPTDTAAALTLGFYAIGRPSCRGCVDEVRSTCRRLGVRRVVIMSDNDAKIERIGGSAFAPGQEGAAALAARLGIPARVVVPRRKDLRAWVAAGVTRADVECLINAKLGRAT